MFIVSVETQMMMVSEDFAAKLSDRFGQELSQYRYILVAMCGRMYQSLSLRRLIQIARVREAKNPEQHTQSFNVCPTTYIPVIKKSKLYIEQKPQNSEQPRNGEERREKKENGAEVEGERGDMKEGNSQDKVEDGHELEFMKWGCHTKFNMLINGCIETLTQKRTFLNMIENRCVVIMEGYYEWSGKDKPYGLKPKTGDHFLVAGLYSDQGEIVILTKDATPELKHIHERMPVLLSHEEVNIWLDPKNTKDINTVIKNGLLNKEKEVWKNVGASLLAPHVNTLKQKSAKCLMTIEDYRKELDKTGLMKYWGKKPVEVVNDKGEVITKPSTQHIAKTDKPPKREFPEFCQHEQHKTLQSPEDQENKDL